MSYRLSLPIAIAAAAIAGASARAGNAQPSSGPTCINADRIVSRRVVGADAIEFRLPRGVSYRTTVRPCPHLTELDRTYIFSFENHEGRRICSGDRFRLIDPVAARSGGGAGFPFCRFGAFERLPGKP